MKSVKEVSQLSGVSVRTLHYYDACNPLHSLGMHFTLLHGIQCIQSFHMESSAFYQDPLGHAAWNSLHSIRIY